MGSSYWGDGGTNKCSGWASPLFLDVLLVATQRAGTAETDWSRIRRTLRPSRSGSTPSPPPASGGRSSESPTPSGCPPTMPCTWNWRSGCSCHWPRWTARLPPPEGQLDSKCRPWLGGAPVPRSGARTAGPGLPPSPGPAGPRPSREHGGSVVGGELLVGGVEHRLVAAGPVHARLFVVRDHEFGDSAPELERPDV